MLQIIVITMLVTLLSNIILKKVHLPTIIGYILTGFIISWVFGLHEAANNHQLKEIGEFGIVFLMFTIGLEFSLMHLKRMKNEVFVTGSLQIVLTTLATYLICAYVLKISSVTSFILAISFSLSSTAIVLKTFNETGEISKRYGQRSLGILIMQDIAVIPILLIIGFLNNPDSDMVKTLVHMSISALILLVLLWLIGKYLLEILLKQIIKTRSDELFTGSILFLAIGASYLSYVLGFSYSLGAFVAGMLIAETKYKHQAEATLAPFRDLLLGIFFITVGMQINIRSVIDYFHLIVLFLLAAMFIKFLIVYLLIRINDSRRTAIKTAFSLIQIGEFSLVVLELAKTSSLIQEPYSQVMTVTISLSMILTPLILKHLTQIADLILKDTEIIPPSNLTHGLENHVVLVGFSEFGKNIASFLKQNEQRYIAIESDIDTFTMAESKNEPIIFGNATNKEILKQSNPSKAKKVIVAVNNLKKLIAILNVLERYVKKENIIVKVHNEQEKDMITDFGIDNIVVENVLASKDVIKTLNKE